jgi:hypothetical protein
MASLDVYSRGKKGLIQGMEAKPREQTNKACVLHQLYGTMIKSLRQKFY